MTAFYTHYAGISQLSYRETILHYTCILRVITVADIIATEKSQWLNIFTHIQSNQQVNGKSSAWSLKDPVPSISCRTSPKSSMGPLPPASQQLKK